MMAGAGRHRAANDAGFERSYDTDRWPVQAREMLPRHSPPPDWSSDHLDVDLIAGDGPTCARGFERISGVLAVMVREALDYERRNGRNAPGETKAGSTLPKL